VVALKKRINAKIIWGGPHCTFMPAETSKISEIDFICVGEGEDALLTLMNHIDQKKDCFSIPNLWARRKNEWIKNEVGSLEENLDKFPFPDRELFFKKSGFFGGFFMKRFMTQRGCPFNCNYCFEPSFKELYKGKGKLVRRHSVQYVIDEIIDTIGRYPTRHIHFSDDSFNLNKNWVREFSPAYRKYVNLPFTCNVSAALVNEELIRNLKEAGCTGVFWGLESGVERIRTIILNKKVTNEQYLYAAHLLRKYNIRLTTYNMVCMPTESIKDAVETIRINKTLKVYNARTHVLKMYKGTKLASYAEENGLTEAEGEFTYKVKDKDNIHEGLKNLIWCSYFLIKIPFLVHFAEKIISSPITKYFKFLIIMNYWVEKNFYHIPVWQAIRGFFKFDPKLLIKGWTNEQKDSYSRSPD